MAEFDLVWRRIGEEQQRFRIDASGLTVGRSPECEVCLDDLLVSRRHARIWREPEGVMAADLDSRNGILVNGRQTVRAHLHPGDELQVGEAVFQVEKIPSSSVGQTVITPEDAAQLHHSIVSDSTGGRLPVLYQAAQLLGTVFDLDELLQRILDLIFDALPVRRGFILTVEQDDSKEIRAVRLRHDDESGPPLSHTVIDHVCRTREAMLTVDAQEDSRFDGAESLMVHGIHSAMCAPLLGRDAVVGAIYLDTGSEAQTFTARDLGLLTAIARVVGVAVENAGLYRANLERERLAAIGEATAGLGHCIKNILTGIRGGGQFIDTAVQQEDLAMLKRGWPILSRAIERIETLVMNMLTFSKDREPDVQPFDVGGLLREVADSQRVRAQKSEVRLEVECRPEGIIRADQPQVYRAILNLVNNAVEACEREGGTVSLLAERGESDWRITVSDTGPGIPEEVLPKLFQAFVSTKGSAGTGLGLACTKKIAEQHGGAVEVQSAPGNGAAFTLVLPHGTQHGMLTTGLRNT